MAAQVLLCIRILQITHSTNTTILIVRNSCLKYANCNSRHILQYWRSEAIIKNYLSDVRNQSNVTSYLTTTSVMIGMPPVHFDHSLKVLDIPAQVTHCFRLQQSTTVPIKWHSIIELGMWLSGPVSTTPPPFCGQTYALHRRMATVLGIAVKAFVTPRFL